MGLCQRVRALVVEGARGRAETVSHNGAGSCPFVARGVGNISVMLGDAGVDDDGHGGTACEI